MALLSTTRKWASIFTQTAHHLRRGSAPNADVVFLKQNWAREVLNIVDLRVNVIGEVSMAPGTLFVGNHLSYLDIPLLMREVPGLAFVAKEEIASWPLIGAGATKAGTIYVKREKRENRTAAREALAEGLKQGARIAVFPSGTTSLSETKEWRRGAFEVARDVNAWVQPFRLRYTPARRAAYIDQDFFPLHLAQLLNKGTLKADLEFAKPIKIQDAESTRTEWQKWSQMFLIPEL